MRSSPASASDAAMEREPKVVARDYPNLIEVQGGVKRSSLKARRSSSTLESTVDGLIQFVLESRTIRHSTRTHEDKHRHP